jgi:hypothetical protein
MARKSPKQAMTDLQKVLDAVTELAPNKILGGITLVIYGAGWKIGECEKEDSRCGGAGCCRKK